MAAYDRAEATGDDGARQRARSALERALAGQIEPAWRLMWRGVELLRGLPPGGHVASRWDFDKESFTGYVAYLGEDGAPQPRRDGAVGAARRLSWLERMTESLAVQRAFDDPLVMAEYRMTGDAFDGMVLEADPARVDRSGARARLRPRIRVLTSDPVHCEPGAALTSPARRGQRARVVSVRGGDSVTTELVLELSGGMGRSLVASPGSVPLPGDVVCYATFSDEFQPGPVFPEPEATPWTHGGPPQRYVPTDEDAQEAWS